MDKPKAPTTPMMQSQGRYRTLCVIVGPVTWSRLEGLRHRLRDARGGHVEMDDAIAYAIDLVDRLAEIAAPPTPKGGAQ
jgi:hypothetical protein